MKSPKAKTPKVYDHLKIEAKWQKKWASSKLYLAKENTNKKKFYGLIEFPYPSGDGLHVGHIRSNTAMDIIARKRRAEGYEVMYPIGWDAFGLPTENYAIKTGIQPAVVTKNNTDTFRRQLKALGFSFDWSREINTTDSKYYKWTQWIFLQFLKNGLAYKKKMSINWCPKDLIGLANEEVVNGKCERCGTVVEKREKEQWMLAITKYADRLDKDLDDVDYLERIKIQQRNWIGKSEGAEIPFRLSTKKNRFVLIHGFEGSAHTNFFPWLKTELEKRGHDVEVPELPNPMKPREDEQVEYVLKNCRFDEHTVIIAHSLGSVVAMKVIEKLNRPVSGLVLAAPALDPSFPGAEPRAYWEGFNWNIDYNKVKELTGGKVAILSDTQEKLRGQYLKELAPKLGAWLKEVTATEEHFCADIEPEILTAVTPVVTVFTTRPDTIYGVTYIVLAPEHPWIGEFLPHVENRKEAEDYVASVKKKTEIERTDATKEKTGVELKGIRGYNPANNEEIPVFIADYVLADYGTGAVMAVPAHDERDFAFAKKYNLPIKQLEDAVVIRKEGGDASRSDEPFVERNAVVCVIQHWSEDKYLCHSVKGTDWKGFVVGGIEGGESAIETGLREIVEETGYKNPRFVRELGAVIHSKFYQLLKKQNRLAHFTPLFFKLENGNRTKVTEVEQDAYEMHWISKDEVSKFISREDMALIWKRATGEDKKEITASVGGNWITKYKLRDWVFSRQRYWGEPIPVIHCTRCGIVPVPEKDLPLELPVVKNYKPTETGESPLAAISDWVNTTCPECLKKKNEPKYFIFDFDGVLGDTWEACVQTKAHIDNSPLDTAGASMKDYASKKPHHARGSIRSAEQLKNDLDWNERFGSKMAQLEIKLFKEFISEVKKFKNAKMAVVSSGSEKYVRPLLKKSGLKLSHVLAFEDSHSKEEKVEQVCKDWGVSPRDIHYFTDTKADVFELEGILDRSKIIGCAWGYSGADGLREVLSSDQILSTFTDIHTYFNTECKATRETDTMPNWAGSSWYYLRYADPKNKGAFADSKKLAYWTPVDWYNGGMEHTTLHLLYSRFWHKFLYDLKLVPTKEPYQKRTSHGLILAEGGEKMSKSKGNVINPDGIVATLGADALRLYEMFMGPFDQPIAWDSNGIVGTRRFVEKVWKLQAKYEIGNRKYEETHTKHVDALMNKTVKKVSDDIESMSFNTAVSTLMIAVNELEKVESISKKQYETLLQLLAPFAPHVTEELWASLGNKKSIHIAPWPQFDPSLVTENEATIVIQINGKTRVSFTASPQATTEQLESTARVAPEAVKWLEGKDIRKVIVVPGRLVNFVVVDR